MENVTPLRAPQPDSEKARQHAIMHTLEALDFGRIMTKY